MILEKDPVSIKSFHKIIISLTIKNFTYSDENEEFFVKLKLLVEETYTLNNNQRVTLLAHSMGAPMSLIFLQRQTQKWKDKFINSLITLAGAWGGSVKALKVFAIGRE